MSKGAEGVVDGSGDGERFEMGERIDVVDGPEGPEVRLGSRFMS